MNEEILQLLRQNARLTDEQIAARIGATPDEVRTVIKELEKSRVLLGYTIVMNPETSPEEPVEAIIALKAVPKHGHGFDEIAHRIGGFPEVRSLSLMSGGVDFLVFIEAPSLKEIARFITEKLATIEDVQSTTTQFVLKKYKKEGVMLEEEAPACRLAVTP